ncbi:alkaline phosphatase family protein [Schlesneria sp. T3-172]|uniref:alkaline phosphatase family protein n=1 Tax=Schlesneria sphaerica TaxID=3373610 RepID=UPI0037CA7FA9
MMQRLLTAVVACLILLALPRPAEAYVGPGAGFALASSFFAVFAAMFSAFVMLFTWPFRLLIRHFFRKRPPGKMRFQRVVILGLDGLDHGLTTRMLAENKLPNLARLRDQGGFQRLGSTLPPISPVAWSSFQTGVNPGKHNIFDFLVPDEQTYRPRMSSVEIHPPRPLFRLGKWAFPFSRPDIRLLRKSRPFWSVLSEYGIFNCIIRVPVSFPPEKLNGVQLSAMCVPDLRGTQGEFTHFTTGLPEPLDGNTPQSANGPNRIRLTRAGNIITAELPGPPHPRGPEQGALKLPFRVTLHDAETAYLKIGREKRLLRRGEYTDWIPLEFKSGLSTTISGVCKFLLLATTPEIELYVTPINIAPQRPAMPIGYPKVYPVYLAKRQGPYATLGLAEDTWGLNESVLSDDQFHQQCLETDQEREAMFFDALDQVPRGLCVCVFDGTDRMQHMFWRYHDDQHPARPAEVPPTYEQAIEKLYARMDELVGRTMAKCAQKETLLMVLSDHGFNSFRRGIDLNRWLELEGYLTVNDDRRDEEYLAGIDWSRTRAFAIGLTGIFLNLKSRFSQGIIEDEGEADRLRTEITERLSALVDPENGRPPIRRIYQALQVYHGPYKSQAPDLIIGYEEGYRVSWEAANGQTSRDVFHANTRAWSGDHCVDPTVVPGVLFCNHSLLTESPRLLDIGPTVLDLFGVPTPGYMDGQVLSIGERTPNGSPSTAATSTAATPVEAI